MHKYLQPRKTQPLSAITQPPPLPLASVGTSKEASSSKALSSSCASSSSSSSPPSLATHSERSTTTTTTTMTTTSASHTLSSSSKSAKEDPQKNGKPSLVELYKRLSSTHLPSPASIPSQVTTTRGPVLPDYEDEAFGAASASIADDGIPAFVLNGQAASKSKPRKRKSVQDDPKYQAVINGSFANKKSKTNGDGKEEKKGARPRKRLTKAKDLIDLEAEEEDEQGNTVAAPKDEHTEDGDVEAAAAEQHAADTDQTHAVAHFERKSAENIKLLETMIAKSAALEAHAKRSRKFFEDELKACKSGCEDAKADVKVPVSLVDMARSFAALFPVNDFEKFEIEWRAETLKVLRRSELLSIRTEFPNSAFSASASRCHVLTYTHTFPPTYKTEDLRGITVNVLAWVNDRDMRKCGIVVSKNFAPELAWIGPVREHSSREDPDDQQRGFWSNACGDAPDHEFAARIFILSHQLGKPFGNDE